MASIVPGRVTLWTLEADGVDPEYFGKVDMRGPSTLQALRFTLESNDILDWPFEFWDAENKCRLRKRMEVLIDFSPTEHVMRSAEVNARKRRRVGDGASSGGGAVEVAPAAGERVQVFEVDGDGEDAEASSVASWRVSGSPDSCEVENPPFRSQLLPNEIMDRYLERAEKMRAEVKQVGLDDHEWWLKTFDLNSCEVVKLWCAECKKDCGGSTKDHTKAQINNLFNNFRRSHVVSTAHVRNYCAAKNISFEDHPQSQAKNGRATTATPEDRKGLILEGVKILERVNASLPEGHLKFRVLRSSNSICKLPSKMQDHCCAFECQ